MVLYVLLCVVSFLCLCGLFVIYCAVLCGMCDGVWCVILCDVCWCCLNMVEWFDCDLLCDVVWSVVVSLLL